MRSLCWRWRRLSDSPAGPQDSPAGPQDSPAGAPDSELPAGLAEGIEAGRLQQLRAWLAISGAALCAQLLASAAWASAARAVSLCAHVPSAASYQLLGEACHVLASAATPLSLAAQGLLPVAVSQQRQRCAPGSKTAAASAASALDGGGGGERARRLVRATMGLAMAVGTLGALCVLALGCAPSLLCADVQVQAALRACAPLGALSVLLGALAQGLYGIFIGCGWLRAFLLANAASAAIALALFARVPAGGGPAALLATWRGVVLLYALKCALGLLQLPALVRTLGEAGVPAGAAEGARPIDQDQGDPLAARPPAEGGDPAVPRPAGEYGGTSQTPS
ncbi:hypothetical protein T492DRAFT_935636 [Pavlovales sp. CCMP2436]|nr:hypothetical protein T492DRAFT_935636 [Pavlovales sp. CCMP2436]